jgi:hypothetical protein
MNNKSRLLDNKTSAKAARLRRRPASTKTQQGPTLSICTSKSNTTTSAGRENHRTIINLPAGRGGRFLFQTRKENRTLHEFVTAAV